MSGNLLFLDTEATGLDERNGRILEVAIDIRTPDLETSLCSQTWLVNNDLETVLQLCDAYVLTMHTDNGLLAELAQESTPRAGLEAIQDDILRLCREHGCIDANIDGKRYSSPLCGSTPSFDRKWLAAHMPRLAAAISYRHVDVSSFLEMVTRWYGRQPESLSLHRAGTDVARSIAMLRAIRGRYFSPYNRATQGPQ